MKNFFMGFFSLILGLMIVVGSVLFFYNGLHYFLDTLTNLPPELSAAIVAGLSALILLCVTKYYEKRAEIEKSIQEKKAPIYEQMMEFFLDMMMAEKLGKEQKTEEQMVQWFYDNNKAIIIWASDDIVKKFSEIRTAGTNETDPEKMGRKILFLVEDLMLLVRKDLGHKNNNLTKGTLLGLFINDIHDFIKN